MEVGKLHAEVGQDHLRPQCGLPLATYFSATKLAWLLDNEPEVRQAADSGKLMFGTVDTWLVWKLTGNHVTDVTNASRTMLMNIKTLDWDQTLLDFFELPANILPTIQVCRRRLIVIQLYQRLISSGFLFRVRDYPVRAPGGHQDPGRGG